MIELTIEEVETVTAARGECANQIVGAGGAGMGMGALAGGALGALSLLHSCCHLWWGLHPAAEME